MAGNPVGGRTRGVEYTHNVGLALIVALELNYRITVLPWFYLQPDVQGIINPGAAHQFGDALVLALQFGVPF